MDPRSGGSPFPKTNTNNDSESLIESLISGYKSWVPETKEPRVQPPLHESVKERQVEVFSSDSNRESTEAPALPSVAELSRRCVSAFKACMRYEGLMDHQWAENRFADFNLFVDAVGALSTSRASLDSRFESRPDDLILVQSILIMLQNFLAECIRCVEAQSNTDTATKEVDSALGNLALIAVAIRRTGIRSRLARTDGRFKPEEHEDLRAFLKIMCSRQHNTANSFKIEIGKEDQADGFKFKTLSTEECIKISTEFKPSETQQRLIEVNLRRRNRFLQAQKHFNNLKARPSDKLDIASNTRRELGNETAQLPNMTPVSQASVKINPTGDSGEKHSPPASTFSGTKASTAQGIFQVPKVKNTASQPAMTAITALTAAAQYPRAPNSCQSSKMFKCPCCCQALPAEFGTNRHLWKKHLSEDISPYTCILPDCSSPFATYNTVLDWEKHFKREHRPCRVCPLCEDSDAVFSGMEDLVTHIEVRHAELASASPDFVQTTVSWSGLTTIGINHCPLCDSSGPEHAPEFIQHVLGCIHDFSLYSLPWAGHGQDVVSQHDWTCEPEMIGDEESPMRRWFEDRRDKDLEVSRIQFHFREYDGIRVEETHPTNDYFKESENEFFGIASAQDSLEVLKRSLESSDYTDESEMGNNMIYEMYHPWLKSSETFRNAISNIKGGRIEVSPIKIAIIDDGINFAVDIKDKIQGGTSFFRDEEKESYLPYYMKSDTLNHGTLIAMFVCTMCPKVKLYICRLNEIALPTGEKYITMQSAAKAVAWATEQGVDIICMGWTIEENAENKDARKLLQNSLVNADAKGIIMISAASDLGDSSKRSWPGKSGRCIRIGASTKTDDVSSFVNLEDVDFLFPGEEVPLSVPESFTPDETTFNSSSVAAAIAAGTAGFLLYLDVLAEKWGGNEQEIEWVSLKGRKAMSRMFKNMSSPGGKCPSLEKFQIFEEDSFEFELDKSCTRLYHMLNDLKAVLT